MSDTNKQYKIDSFDFGFNGPQKTASDRQPSAKKHLKLLSKASFFKGLQTISFYTSKTFKTVYSTFNRVKWNVSRSIFLGRGVYFKYISNLSILIIVVFGTFVYMGYQASQGNKGFISKFSNVAWANEGVLFNAGDKTVLSQKPAAVVKYVVNGGDTLSSIAQKYSTPDNVITIDTIMWANAIKVTDLLRPGMVLDIPPVQGTLHTVKKGDTILAIAKKYGRIGDKSSPEETTGVTQEITDINYLDIKVDGDARTPVLVEGQRIIIPNGVMPDETPRLAAAPANIPAKNPPVAAIKQPSQPPVIVAPGQFIWPVASGGGTVTQYYSKYHTAMDIADRSGPMLVSIASGTVTFAGYQAGGGANVVIVKFDNGGYSALYAHLASIGVTTGQRVAQNQVLGRMGCTGACTGTHVHFAMYLNGAYINPINYIKR
jgi:murein DD-endopeptidase MepM/ murein hydrolase activator NlpD